ncbi:MAG: hypothetical protein LBC53_06405 [Spirochaetaceae bacterium]|jgi:hypothetical protein|nr:hypothetical protein [Spirochaetaceae bacterium]
MKTGFLFLIYFYAMFFAPLLPAQDGGRVLLSIFPDIPQKAFQQIQENGIYINEVQGDEFLIKPAEHSGLPDVAPKKENENYFKHKIETLIFIKEAKNRKLIDVYNSLNDIKTLKGRLYYSFTRKKETALFLEAYRMTSEKNHAALLDEPPYTEIPAFQTRYFNLRDVNFGQCYYRAQVLKYGKGLQFTLTNFKAISFLFIPIIKEEDLFINYYIEPLADGVLLYGIIAAQAPNFIENHIDLKSSVIKRVELINGWIIDGLKGGS